MSSSRRDSTDKLDKGHGLGRRGFLLTGGAAAATVAAGCATAPGRGAAPASQPVSSAGPASRPAPDPAEAAPTKPRIRAHRVLGRTGFKVSDIGLGCGRISDAAVVRHLVDRGVNYFDTAERYGNGDSERKLGEAMPHLERGTIFITTKLKIAAADTEQTILDRFGKCLERMRTPYADALFMHSVTDVKLLDHGGFHKAVSKLKAAGKLRHAGVSSHGPRDSKGDGMEKVLVAVAADGRFDLMLLVYNYLNRDQGEEILAACKANNVGATLMKVAPGRLRVPTFDPDSPGDFAPALRVLMGRGMTRAEAVAKIKSSLARQAREQAKNQARVDAFVARHGVKTEQELRAKSVLWSLQNEDAHTVCVSMPDFETVDRILPLSGQKLARADARLLRDHGALLSGAYCRHGCTACAGACPRGVPVSTVMRYAYYFEHQGRQKYAMQKYTRLGRAAESCVGCAAPCLGSCPHGLAIQDQLVTAHQLLSMA